MHINFKNQQYENTTSNSGFRLQVSSCRLQVAGFKFQVAGFKFQVAE